MSKRKRKGKGKGQFHERLDRAVQSPDTITIRRFQNEMDKYDFYLIEVEIEDETFGVLRQHEEVLVHRATPGKLVTAIEKCVARIKSAVNTITEAQIVNKNKDKKEEPE